MSYFPKFPIQKRPKSPETRGRSRSCSPRVDSILYNPFAKRNKKFFIFGHRYPFAQLHGILRRNRTALASSLSTGYGCIPSSPRSGPLAPGRFLVSWNRICRTSTPLNLAPRRSAPFRAASANTAWEQSQPAQVRLFQVSPLEERMRQADPLQIHAPQVAAVKHRIRKIPAADRKARQIGPGKTAAAAIAAPPSPR